MRFKYLVIIGLFLISSLLLLSRVNPLLGEEKYSILNGTVKSIEGKLWMEVENEEDARPVRLRIGWRTVYTPHRYPNPGEQVKIQYLIHKGTPVAYTVIILEGEIPKAVSKETPSTVAKRQEEIETKELATSKTSPVVDQRQTAPPAPRKKKEQPKPMEPREKRIEPKPLEAPKIVENTIDPSQAARIEDSQKAETLSIDTRKPASIEQTKSIAKPTKTIVPQGKRTLEPNGTGTGGIIIYLIPLIIGVLIGSITHWGKTNLFINGINKFDAWIINKQSELREQVGKGRIKKYCYMPILWILNKVIKLSEKIQNEAIRCGVKTAAYLYLLGIIAIITFYATTLIVVLIVVIIILWLISKTLGWSEKERLAQVYVKESKKEDQFSYRERISADTKEGISSRVYDESKKEGLLKYSGHNSRIVFERHGDSGWLPLGIFTINPDGSDCVQILSTSTGSAPEWSPDGEWIAFHEVPKGYESYASNIHIMRPNGEDVRQVTFHQDGAATCPTWSPDSKKIVYCLWKDQVHQIWTVDIENPHSEQITFQGSNGYPVWTPSNKIFFRKEDTSPSKIFVMDPDGKNQRECDLFQEGDQEPTWSHDGNKIVFVRNGKICVMNADGNNFREIPGAKRVLVEVSWSPDGQKIVYSCTDWTSGHEIYIVDLETGDHTKIVENPFGPKRQEVGSCNLYWSPWLNGPQKEAKEHFNKGILKQILGNKEAIEEAIFHFEEALRLGGLSTHEQSMCHYFLGFNYLELGRTSEGIMHCERLLALDRNFECIEKGLREDLKGNMLSALSIAYKVGAKDINDHKGTQTAIIYLEDKIKLLGDLSAPETYVTLGCYYGMQEEHNKARELFKRAIGAPTYGSEFQANSIKSARGFLKKPEIEDFSAVTAKGKESAEGEQKSSEYCKYHPTTPAQGVCECGQGFCSECSSPFTQGKRRLSLCIDCAASLAKKKITHSYIAAAIGFVFGIIAIKDIGFYAPIVYAYMFWGTYFGWHYGGRVWALLAKIEFDFWGLILLSLRITVAILVGMFGGGIAQFLLYRNIIKRRSENISRSPVTT